MVLRELQQPLLQGAPEQVQPLRRLAQTTLGLHTSWNVFAWVFFRFLFFFLHINILSRMGKLRWEISTNSEYKLNQMFYYSTKTYKTVNPCCSAQARQFCVVSMTGMCCISSSPSSKGANCHLLCADTLIYLLSLSLGRTNQSYCTCHIPVLRLLKIRHFRSN